jgi:hypothetical protein
MNRVFQIRLKLQVDISSYYDGKNDSKLQVVPFRRLSLHPTKPAIISALRESNTPTSKSVIVKVEKQ